MKKFFFLEESSYFEKKEEGKHTTVYFYRTKNELAKIKVPNTSKNYLQFEFKMNQNGKEKEIYKVKKTPIWFEKMYRKAEVVHKERNRIRKIFKKSTTF